MYIHYTEVSYIIDVLTSKSECKKVIDQQIDKKELEMVRNNPRLSQLGACYTTE